MSEDSSSTLIDRRDFREFIDHLENVVVWSGLEGEFDYISDGFEDIWGRPATDALADPSVIIEGTHPEDREKVQAILEGKRGNVSDGESVDFEHRVVKPDGEIRWVEVRIFPVQAQPDGAPIVIGVTLDITSRKEMELDLQYQNERLDQFTTLVSHDLRNPLNVAQGQIQLAREKGLDDEHLHVALTALNRMDELVNDMLALAQLEERTWETNTCHLPQVVDECWQNVLTDNATIENRSSKYIEADIIKLRQLLENVFRNSIEHGGDDIRVTIGDLTDGFFIEDDGTGIPEPIRKDIFKAGVTTRNEGTGYGLAIVKEIVEGHDWQIDLQESDSGGTRFEITGVHERGTPQIT